MEVMIEEWGEDEERRQRERREEEGKVFRYEDGSIVDGRVRVAVCRMDKRGTRRWGVGYALGNKTEIIDAEIVGIRKAMERVIGECRRERKRSLTIRTDSQEAMRMCTKREQTGDEMMASKIRWWWDAARENRIKVKLEWVKGRNHKSGHDQSDKLAAEGREKKNRDKDAFISFAWIEH